mgnify:CR=1 FL=1
MPYPFPSRQAPAPGAEKIFTTPRDFGQVAEVLGSQFLGHPPIEPYEVHITQPEHPLAVGIEPFTVTDELYVNELHGPLDVVMHAHYSGPCRGFEEGHTEGEEHVQRPILYTKPTGSGSVLYFTLGHCRGRFDMQDMGRDDLGKVALVGAGMKTSPGIAAKMFRVLADEKINIEMISTSTIRISVVVAASATERACQALHTAFGLDSGQAYSAPLPDRK